MAKKTALFGLLSALALSLSFLEGLIFPTASFLPVGVKIGLSNIVTMLAAKIYGIGGGMGITLIKALFAFATRGFTAGLMSLGGGVISTLAMSILIKLDLKNVSFIGIGALSAALHSIGQLCVAMFLSGTMLLLGYGKYLLMFAIPLGALTGAALNIIMPKIEKITLRKEDYK